MVPTRYAVCPLITCLALLVGCGPNYPNCNDDSHCHDGEFCVNGHCQQCRPGGDDCPDGRECNDGRCDPIDGYCSSESACPGDEECVENRCVTRSVTESTPTDTTAPTACTLAPVSFAYDSSEISGAAGDAIEANARCVQERDIERVRLTGHCDPRGTEEYNLALGDRRARSVLSYMQRLGVDGSRMSARSMGEEMADENDESSWSRSRRVDVEER